MPLLRPIVPTEADAPAVPRLAPIVARRIIPFEADLASMLEGLLGRDVTVRTPADEPGTFDPSLTAIYADADGVASASIAFDLALAATGGAALALIPTGQAEEWIRDGTLTEDGHDNAAEILNVLAAAFNDRNPSRHVKLVGVHDAGDDIEPAIAAALLAPSARLDLIADVDGYPSGRLRVSIL